MSFVEIIESILIGPLKLAFEVIFVLAGRFVSNPGYAIIILSLVVNFLVLPLYRRADAMQEEARDIEARLKKGVDHIKKNFSGDERMMILQTYYRQNNYKPTDVFKGSISLLLEIPFFIAAYQFLSGLTIIQGVSLGPIADLGKPDGLLVIGGLAVNVLPIIMTVVNCISGAIYTKKFPLKTKIQLYAMALFFLVFLYNSPSCLVFYWTLNNLFSLVKNIFYKLKNPKKVLTLLSAAAGGMLVLGIFFFNVGAYNFFSKKRLFILAAGIALLAPLCYSLIRPHIHINRRAAYAEPASDRRIFIAGALFLTLFIGALIPSELIVASPQEYVIASYYVDPIWYIVSALCLSIGTFLVWMPVFYWLTSKKWKAVFERLLVIVCGAALVDFMFFGRGLGLISPDLKYDNDFAISLTEKVVNIAVLVVLAVILYLVAKKWKSGTAIGLTAAIISLICMSGINIVKIRSSLNVLTESVAKSHDDPYFKLSKTGKNVVVIMLDRAVNAFVPFIFNEKPEIKEQFSGFTYYNNTTSFAIKTNFALPAIAGGYEYTPLEMNKRDNEPLVVKHNEALKVMPVLFDQNGYDVTVCDPYYANYQMLADLSIYDEYPDIKSFITEGRFTDLSYKQEFVRARLRNFFCHSIMKVSPAVIQGTLYNSGIYNNSSYLNKAVSSSSFSNSFNVLVSLPDISKISEEGDNFVFLCNSTTHEPRILQKPDYLPSENIDNENYDKDNADIYTIGDKKLNTENEVQMEHYHVNMAAFIQLGKWFDYLRENDVYDNTRIILVSDHSEYSLKLMGFPYNEIGKAAEGAYSLLMVKDFNSKDFSICEEFMTIADVPTIALSDIIEDPINPFTGKAINSNEKNTHEQFICYSWDWKVWENNGNTFFPTKWLSVKDDIRVYNNWTLFDEITTDPTSPSSGN